MKKVTLKIGGMSCSGCSSRIEKYLNSKDGIKANINLVLGIGEIEYDSKYKVKDIENFIKEIGYESLGVYNPKEETENKRSHEKTKIFIFLLLTIIVLYITMGSMIGLYVPDILNSSLNPKNYATFLLILNIPYFWYGFDIFKKGFKSIYYRSYNMDTLVTIGVLASFLYSMYNFIQLMLGDINACHSLYFESSMMVIFFIKLGRFIENNRQEKTKEALKELVQITPNKAIIKKDGKEIEVTIDEIKKGDTVIAKPGMKIAVDGKIIKGETHIDEAFITGEALPLKKKINDKVLAGSMNIDGYIEYEALKIGPDSTISEIVRLVVEASTKKAPIQKLADKVSSYFVPSIIVIGILTFLGYLILGKNLNEAVISMVTVLVVACPCALGLATPLAIITSVGNGLKKGILIKTSEILENVSSVTTILFDKTGTLTYGNLKVSKIFNYSKIPTRELMELAYNLEEKSTHPIAKAFLQYAKNDNLKKKDVEEFKNIPGIGLKGKIENQEVYLGNDKLFSLLKIKNNHIDDYEELTKMGSSIIYLIVNKKVLGLIGVSDVIRSDAKETIKNLKKLNKEIIILTGDNEKTAKIIADSLDIKEVKANLMPKDKANIIKELEAKGKKVMMIGDGINDAPSLALSFVSVSVQSGTDIALDSADVILLHDKLSSILDLFNISKKTLKIIRENLFWAFFYNILMIPLAIGLFKFIGLSVNPMIASIAMTISSLTVVLNSLRLKQ